MGKIDAIFKAEIVRLTRKEVRPLANPLKRQIRDLARQVKTLTADTVRLTRLTRKLEEFRGYKVGATPLPEQRADKARMSAGLIKKLRAKLNITQGQLAALADVSPAAVQSWEQDIARPGGVNKAALISLRKLGRREIVALLEEKGVAQPGRKPRTALREPAPAKKAPKAGKRGKRTPAKV